MAHSKINTHKIKYKLQNYVTFSILLSFKHLNRYTMPETIIADTNNDITIFASGSKILTIKVTTANVIISPNNPTTSSIEISTMFFFVVSIVFIKL